MYYYKDSKDYINDKKNEELKIFLINNLENSESDYFFDIFIINLKLKYGKLLQIDKKE